MSRTLTRQHPANGWYLRASQHLGRAEAAIARGPLVRAEIQGVSNDLLGTATGALNVEPDCGGRPEELALIPADLKRHAEICKCAGKAFYALVLLMDVDSIADEIGLWPLRPPIAETERTARIACLVLYRALSSWTELPDTLLIEGTVREGVAYCSAGHLVQVTTAPMDPIRWGATAQEIAERDCRVCSQERAAAVGAGRTEAEREAQAKRDRVEVWQ